MPRQRRNERKRDAVIDLTLSENEGIPSEAEVCRQLDIPAPTTQPSRPRRLTVRECLRADRIAYGEIDAPPPPDLFAGATSPPSPQETLDLVDEITPNEVHAQRRKRSTLTKVDLSNLFRHIAGIVHGEIESHEALERRTNHSDVENRICLEEDSGAPAFNPMETDTGPEVISIPSESGDSSDDEFVLYGEKDIMDLTTPDEEPEVVEMMAHGRPRRACAPVHFDGLLQSTSAPTSPFKAVLLSGRRQLVRSLLTKEERSYADKYRADLTERAFVAQRVLWENRLDCQFSHNCGKIDVGPARAALVRMGSVFGAKTTVVKKKEHGRVAKYVVMAVGKRLCSPAELDIRAIANILIDLAFKGMAEKKKKTNFGTEALRKSRREKKVRRIERTTERIKERMTREVQRSERMREVAQGVRKDEDAFNRVIPIQVEIQRDDIKTEGEVKLENVAASSGSTMMNQDNIKTEGGVKLESVAASSGPTMMNRNGRIKPEPVPIVSTSQTSTIADNEGENSRKRRIDSETDGLRSNETRHTAWERRRRQKLKGTKVECGNRGFSMLAKMGWSEGTGLGATRNGIREPIVAEFRTGRRGLGKK